METEDKRSADIINLICKSWEHKKNESELKIILELANPNSNSINIIENQIEIISGIQGKLNTLAGLVDKAETKK